jgi:hypothetical protein
VNIRAHITSSVPVVPTKGGFPTFAGTDWADPIVASQSLATAEPVSSSESSFADVDADGTDTDTGGDGEDGGTKAGRRQPGQVRGKRGWTVVPRASASASGSPRAAASGAAQASRSEPDFDEVLLAGLVLGPGGPGESWAGPNVVW